MVSSIPLMVFKSPCSISYPRADESMYSGGVELLDDLDDHWTAKSHKSERNWVSVFLSLPDDF